MHATRTLRPRAGRAHERAGFVLGLTALVGMLAFVASPAAAAVKTTLKPGESLKCSQTLKSTNGLFRFVFQCDGNLVLLDKGSAVLWHSGTNGKGGTKLVQQADGNLVLFGPASKVIWHTSTHRNPGAYLRMQDDGNLVIYKSGGGALWFTRTSANCESGEVCLYDGNAPSGFVVHDTTASTIDDYGASRRRFHNGVAVNDHASSIVNNSDQQVCFFENPGFTGGSVCLPPRTQKTAAALGALNNKLSSHRPPPSATCPVGVELEEGGPGYILIGDPQMRFGTADLTYGLKSAAAEWEAGAVSPGTFGRLAINEMSQKCGGDVSGHASHECGTDVDVGPLKVYPYAGWGRSNYSQSATSFFLNFTAPKHLHLIRVFFNDPALYSSIIAPWPGHEDHFHARIAPPPEVAACCARSGSCHS